jgi:hypothetical protein
MKKLKFIEVLNDWDLEKILGEENFRKTNFHDCTGALNTLKCDVSVKCETENHGTCVKHVHCKEYNKGECGENNYCIQENHGPCHDFDICANNNNGIACTSEVHKNERNSEILCQSINLCNKKNDMINSKNKIFIKKRLW